MNIRPATQDDAEFLKTMLYEAARWNPDWPREPMEEVLDEPIIRIGRLEEPVDAFGQIRVNHIAFLDVRDGVNETVGRAHARLQIDAASGHYHLFNEGSSNPTSIVRAGRTLRFDPQTYTFIGDSDANQYLTRPEYRAPWLLPKIADL